MYFLNFVVTILGAAFAIWQGYRNDVMFCLVDIGIAIVNLPFAIKWVTSLFK